MKTRLASRPFPAALLSCLIAAMAVAPWAIPGSARAQMFIVSTDASGTLSSIGEYSPAGVPIKVPLISGLQLLGGIAVSGNNLFVLLHHNVGENDVGTINEYTIAGTLVKTSLVTGIADPGLIAVSGTNLFAITEVLGTNALIGTIKEYSAVTGALENASLATGLIQPYGMVISGSDIFVAGGNGAGTIGKYPIVGGVAQPSFISGLPYLGGLAISGSDLFVTEYNNNSDWGLVGEYTTAGATVNSFLVLQSAESFLPSGIGVSGTNMLVSNEATTGVVAEFATDGVEINPALITGINPSSIAVLPILLPMSATTLTTTGTGLPGAPLVFTAKQSVANATVQLESSLDDSTWTPLTDAKSGVLAQISAGVYGTGAKGTTFYPAGKTVYFRAVSSETGYNNNISNVVGPFVLEQGVLSVSYALTSTSDPTAGLVTHIGDKLTYTFTWTNSGNAPASGLQLETPVPTYIDATSNLQYQFPNSALTYNSSATYTGTSATVKAAYVTWNLPTLPPNSKQSVPLIVSIGSQVRIDQQLGLGTNYMVSSTFNQPPTPATGYVYGVATTPGTDVEGPISFTMTPASKTVAPGGLITYHCVLSNLGVAVTGAFATVVVPDSLRFAFSYTVGGSTVSGVTSATPGVYYGENFALDSPNPQVVVEIGAIAAKATVDFDVTFQAQWVVQPIVPTIDYGAGFLDAADYAQFQSDFNAGGGTQAAPNTVDYTTFLDTGTPATDKDVVSTNQSGVVTIAVAGSLHAEPFLTLSKLLNNQATDTLDSSTGTVNLAKPGSTLTYQLIATNSGLSEADDVYIEEDLPLDASFVSATIASSTPSSTQSKTTFFHTLDPVGADGHHHHVLFTGLKLLPNDRIFIQYTALVDSGGSAPPNGTVIDSDASTIGSSSTPSTPPGFYIGVPIQVTGTVSLAQPIVTPGIPTAEVSSGVAATATALNTFYAQAASRTSTKADPFPPSDIPLTIPGEERYYIRYYNGGSVPAAGVTVQFPIPAHTAFYRASFATLAPGSLNYDFIPPAAADKITPPAGANGGFLTTGGTATFTIGSLASGSTGYAMVEVIVGPGAVQEAASVIGTTDGPIVIKDTAGDENDVSMPKVSVATTSTVTPAAPIAGASRTTSALPPAAATPAVPQLGMMRIAPQAVTSGSNFNITWLIYNFSDQASPVLDLNFALPAGVTFVTHFITNEGHGGSFFISGPPNTAGSLYESEYNALPAHSAISVTYTFTASGATTPVVDNYDYIAVNYGADIHTSPANIGILAKGTPLPQGTNLQYTASCRPLHYFLANSTDVFVLDISAAQDHSSTVVFGPDGEVSGGTTISDLGGDIAVYGLATGIKIGTTTPSFMLGNLSNGASLAPYSVKPALVMVGPGESYPMLANATVAAAGTLGAYLISQDGGNFSALPGAGVIGVNGAAVIGVNGCAVIGVNGAAIVAAGAGNLTAPKGAEIVAAGAGNVIGVNGAALLPSTPNSTGLAPTANGAIITEGGGQ